MLAATAANCAEYSKRGVMMLATGLTAPAVAPQPFMGSIGAAADRRCVVCV